MDDYRVDLLGRTLPSQQAQQDQGPGNAKPPAEPFSKVLEESIAQVNDLQHSADARIRDLALGEADDISEVVVAVSQAELSLRLMVQIRDKLTDAYQQIARMPI